MLGRIFYKTFKPIFLKHYFNEQSKRSGFENMQKSFIDSNNKQYYTPLNHFDFPSERVKAIEKGIMRLKAGLSEEDEDLILDTMEKALNSGKKSELSMIGHCIIEMRKRKDLVLHPDVLFDIVALKHIREDEKPHLVDPVIHREKVEQLKRDSNGGLYDFFYKMGLTTLIPYLEKLESDWSEFMTEGATKVKALKTHLEASSIG